jgi:hypothetical protein
VAIPKADARRITRPGIAESFAERLRQVARDDRMVRLTLPERKKLLKLCSDYGVLYRTHPDTPDGY